MRRYDKRITDTSSRICETSAWGVSGSGYHFADFEFGLATTSIRLPQWQDH
jgi:hypothetical protein